MKYAIQDENGHLCVIESIDDSIEEELDNAIRVDDIVFNDGYEYYIEDGVLKSRKRVIYMTEFEKTQKALQATVERQEFLEDCLVELINEVYSE